MCEWRSAAPRPRRQASAAPRLASCGHASPYYFGFSRFGVRAKGSLAPVGQFFFSRGAHFETGGAAGLFCDCGRSCRIVHGEKNPPRSITNDDVGISRRLHEYRRPRVFSDHHMRQ
jgi:hypothetical protein